MIYFLGLGSNQKPRRSYLEKALKDLSREGEVIQISPLYETPALLPKNAEDNWNQPYLNMTVQFDYAGPPDDFLIRLKKIENHLGRSSTMRWAPRPIDIDILLWEKGTFKSAELQIPHPEMGKRSFVLDPLKDIHQDYVLAARKSKFHAPLWMGIVNLTPDSFSDGGECLSESEFIRRIQNYYESGVQIIDVGAESTRPDHSPISPEVEQDRLKPFLRAFHQMKSQVPFFPLLSVDTRNGSTAALALDWGAQIINDVSGLSDPTMKEVLRASKCHYVLTHNEKKRSLSVPEIKSWMHEKVKELGRLQVPPHRLIFDPGLGFKKRNLDNLNLIQNLDEFTNEPIRILAGHSRKSFMKPFSKSIASQRDYESIGLSLGLIQKGVDILRVHNPDGHIRAHRGWSHAQSQNI